MNALTIVLGAVLALWALAVLGTKRDHWIELAWALASLACGLFAVVATVR